MSDVRGHIIQTDKDICDQLVARAQSLASVIRERAVAADEQRRQPENTIREIIDSQLIRLLIPRLWGGYELSFDTFVDTVLEVSQADGSAGWCYSFLVIHAWLLASFPEKAQSDVWTDHLDVPLATAFTPAGHYSCAANGYYVDGDWPWSSGVDHCEWNMLLALPAPAERHYGPRLFLLPHSDYEINDRWFVTGLKASGSKNAVVKNIFVPEYRSVKMADLIVGNAPGTSVNSGVLYNLPLMAAYQCALVSPILGATIGAYKIWREITKTKYSRLNNQQIATLTHRQIEVAKVAAEIDSALMLLRRNLDVIRDGGPLSLQLYNRIRRDYAYICVVCTQAVEKIYTSSGGTANFESNPLQRYWRDVHAMAAHATLNFDTAGEAFGRYELGLPPNVTDAFALG